MTAEQITGMHLGCKRGRREPNNTLLGGSGDLVTSYFGDL